MLDPLVQARLVEAIELGVTIETAADYAGICRRTYYNWLARARQAEAKQEAGLALSPVEGEFLRFLHTLTRAHARAEVHLVNVLHKIAEGGYVTRTRTRVRKTDPVSGQRYIEVSETWFARPSFRAVAFMLSRRWPQTGGTPAQQAAGRRRDDGGHHDGPPGPEFIAAAERIGQAARQVRARSAAGGPSTRTR